MTEAKRPDFEPLPDEIACQFCDPPMTLEEFRAYKHPFQVAALARAMETAKHNAEAAVRNKAQADRAAELAAKRANGPLAIVRGLVSGDSHLFTQYQRASQLSSAIATAQAQSASRFSCSVEYSLVDGSIIGVRVTRIA